MMMRKKQPYALVLAGGGSKGIYQLGAWQAFRKLDIRFKAVIGTSIGSLNGAMIVCGDPKRFEQLWENAGIDKIVNIPRQLITDGTLQWDLSNIKELGELGKLLTNKHSLGLDTTPLRNMIRENVDEEKIRRSGIDFGLMTYNLSKMKPAEIFVDKMPPGTLHDYLLASATVPGFQFTKIGKHRFIDGGVYDNIPYAMARKRGYRRIIVVDISGPGINKKIEPYGAQTVYIKNSLKMGHLFDFSPAFLGRFRLLGYLDTLKVFEKIHGIKYFYLRDAKLAAELEQQLFSGQGFARWQELLPEKKGTNSDPRELIREYLPKTMRLYPYIIEALAECAAESLGLEIVKEYSFDEFITAIWQEYSRLEQDTRLKEEQQVHSLFKRIKRNFATTKWNHTNLKLSPYAYDKAFRDILGKRIDFHTHALEYIFPNLLGAKIFFTLAPPDFKQIIR